MTAKPATLVENATSLPVTLADIEVVLTVPASFDEVARELTVEAARRAGFTAVYVVPGARVSPPGAALGSAGDRVDAAALVGNAPPPPRRCRTASWAGDTATVCRGWSSLGPPRTRTTARRRETP